MRCEVVAIGTELLLGQIVDTNSSWIGERLALIGVDSHFQVKVGDNAERMEFCIRQALARSDAVICCGGLGPTQDDITREVIARVMGVALRRDPEVEQRIVDLFRARGRAMTENNRRQADIPEGGRPIAQMPGTAPGLVCPVGGKVIYAVPGVPHEMREMMAGTVLADLQQRSGAASVIRSRVLRTWGQSESGLAEILADRIDALDDIGNPTLAFQASGIEGIKVRITAKARDEAAAAGILADEEKLVRGLLGDAVFGVDDETMESVVLAALRRAGGTLAAAEAFTGGLAAARLTAFDPGMEIFLGGTVGRWPGAEPGAAGGDGGAAGDARAAAAAREVREGFGASVGIAALGPDPGEDAPPGLVRMAVVMAGEGGRAEETHTQSVALPGDRRQVREYAVIHLLSFLRRALAG